MNKFILFASIVLIVSIKTGLADKQSAINLLTLHASCRDKATNPDAMDNWQFDDKSVVNCYFKCMMESTMAGVIREGKFVESAFVNLFDTATLKTKATSCVADYPSKADDLCGEMYDLYYCVYQMDPKEAQRSYFVYFNTTAEEEKQVMPEFEEMMTKL